MSNQENNMESGTTTEVQPKTDQELFDAGREISRQKIGEPHDYSEVLWGVNEVLKAKGRGYDDALTLSYSWHNPLVMEKPDTPVKTIIGRMAYTLRGAAFDLPRGYKYDTRQHQPTTTLLGNVDDAVSDLGAKPGDTGFDTRVTALIDSAIKSEYPGTRRGTKKYKELHAKALKKAQKQVSDDLRASAKARIPSYRQRIMERIKGIEETVATLTYYENKAKDILAMDPVCEDAKEILATTQGIRERFNAIIEYYGQLLKRLADAECGSTPNKES